MPERRACKRGMLRTPGARMREAVAPLPTTFRLVPRPYQYEAVAALLAATARGVQRPLLVLPTGTGKTIVFALLVQRRRGRSLILAHRDELIQQAVAKLHLVDPTLPLGVVQAARDEHTAPVVVASVQTLSRRARLTPASCRISRPSSLTKRTTPPPPPTGASWSIAGRGGPMARSWWGSRRPPSAAITTPCGRSLTALSIRK